VIVSNLEMSELVEELQAANHEIKDAVAWGLLEGRDPCYECSKSNC